MGDIPDWYERLKESIEALRESQKSNPSRYKAITITMLEQALAYAWVFVVSQE